MYHRVVELARRERAFLTGDLQEAVTSAPADVIAYRRGRALVLVNARGHEVHVTVTDFQVNGARDLLTNRAVRGDTLALPAYGALVLER